MSLKFKYSMIF